MHASGNRLGGVNRGSETVAYPVPVRASAPRLGSMSCTAVNIGAQVVREAMLMPWRHPAADRASRCESKHLLSRAAEGGEPPRQCRTMTAEPRTTKVTHLNLKQPGVHLPALPRAGI